MNSVTAALTAVRQRRFDELGSLLAPDIDWRGLAGEDGQAPRCHGRARALEVMREGLLAAGEVSVGRCVEHGDRVLAPVQRPGEDVETSEWFVLAEVHDGRITRLRAYATEPEARTALHG